MGDSVPPSPRPTCYCICDHNRQGSGGGAGNSDMSGSGPSPLPGSPSRSPGANGSRANDPLPSYWGSVKQLWSRTGFGLAIDPSGRVYGSPEDFSPYAVLRLSSVDVAEVQIFGVESKLYLAMDHRGKLYGEADQKNPATVFVESYDKNTNHNNYLSRKNAHMGWYVGIKKSGKPKPGPKTAFGQKAIQFLPRQARPDASAT